MSIELPEDRVIAFAEELERWDGPDAHIHTTGEYGTPVRYTLNLSDLRDVLDELAEHQRLLIAIDKALDDPDYFNALAAIKYIMGNHKNEEV